jgi:hypothetical protein
MNACGSIARIGPSEPQGVDDRKHRLGAKNNKNLAVKRARSGTLTLDEKCVAYTQFNRVFLGAARG